METFRQHQSLKVKMPFKIYTYDSSKSSTNPLQKAISSKKTEEKGKKGQNVYNKCWLISCFTRHA